jgi:hypothetical protein
MLSLVGSLSSERNSIFFGQVVDFVQPTFKACESSVVVRREHFALVDWAYRVLPATPIFDLISCGPVIHFAPLSHVRKSGMNAQARSPAKNNTTRRLYRLMLRSETFSG